MRAPAGKVAKSQVAASQIDWRVMQQSQTERWLKCVRRAFMGECAPCQGSATQLAGCAAAVQAAYAAWLHNSVLCCRFHYCYYYTSSVDEQFVMRGIILLLISGRWLPVEHFSK